MTRFERRADKFMTKTTKSLSILAVAGFLMALAATVAGILAGPTYRFDLLSLREAFNLLRWAAYGGAAGGVVCILGLIHARPGSPRKGFWLALVGLLIGAAVFWLPFSQQRAARSVPPIHDITTDTSNPPEFRAVLALRADGGNNPAYGGESVARQQHAAYPDIRPARFAAAADKVFSAALDTARGMGWRIVTSVPDQGRIEAVDTTFWFGFRDDVVIRVTDSNGGTRVDLRSASRVGVSDIGTNARRIRRFLSSLRSRVGDT